MSDSRRLLPRRRRRVVLWGFHRGDLGYAFVPGEVAWRLRLEPIGDHDFLRNIVTVIR